VIFSSSAFIYDPLDCTYQNYPNVSVIFEYHNIVFAFLSALDTLWFIFSPDKFKPRERMEHFRYDDLPLGSLVVF
jgi:hypothetical protein